MDRKLGIFGGTTEGRLLAETCTACRIPALVSVATEYGRGLLGESPFLTVHTGRMDEETMTRWMEDNGLTDVIDATHPYAREASDNIRKACARSGASYHRLVREGTGTGADGGTAEQNGGIAGQNGGMEEQNGGGTGQNGGMEEQNGGGTGQNGHGPADPGREDERICWVPSVEEAALFLEKEMAAHQERKALIATGSKELFHFARIAGAAERLYARVLPSAEGIAACRRIGLNGRHIMAMQGPFSYAMNLAMLQAADASYLVTKRSGRAGGFQEKLEAALKLGCQVIVVRRPEESGEQGEDLEALTAWIKDVYGKEPADREAEGGTPDGRGPGGGIPDSRGPGDGIPDSRGPEGETPDSREPEGGTILPGQDGRRPARKIVLLGIGTGGLEQMTIGGLRALLGCDAILGASRMVESCMAMLKELEAGWPGALWAGENGAGGSRVVPVGEKASCITYRPEEMLAWLGAHPKVERPLAVYSGDVGFYSGAKRLEELAAREPEPFICRRIPGISSMTYLAARLGKSWEEVGIMSLHGRGVPEAWELSSKKEWSLLLDGPAGLSAVCRKLIQEGWDQAKIWVGQRLSYPDETVISGTPGELMDAKIHRLSVAWVILEGERP